MQEVDRTGAGDVFDGAFVYGLSKGYDLEKCLRLANIAGALSTTKYGAKQSIPLLSDVIRYYEEKFGSLNAEPPVVENFTPATQEAVPVPNEVVLPNTAVGSQPVESVGVNPGNPQ